jgi:hypothetical protein
MPHNSCSKIRICVAEFSTDLTTQTRLLLDFPQTSAPKPDCYKTYNSWIPIMSTTQNHPWSVSSELGWLRSNGFALMTVVCLHSGSNIRICPVFSTDISTQTRLTQDLQLMDPYLDHPKIFQGVYEVNKNGPEAIVLLSRWLDA